MSRVRPVSLLAVLALASCSDGTGPRRLEPCSEPPRVTVTGTEPVITWSPACTVGQLWIVSLENRFGGPTAWGIAARDTFSIAPPVRFGEAPANTSVIAPATSLGRDTTYFAWVTTARPGPVASTGIEGRSAPFTACGALRGDECVATPEVFHAQTASGVRLTAAIDRSTITRGVDTAIVTLAFDNPGAQAVTLPSASGCGPAYAESYLGGLPESVYDANCFTAPVPSLTVPAGGRVTQQFRSTAAFDLPQGNLYCPPAGTYEIRFVTRDWTAGRRAATNAVRLTVRENRALAARCTLPA